MRTDPWQPKVRRYPKMMKLWSDPPGDELHDWVSQPQAAQLLGVRGGSLRIGLMIANGTVDPVEHPERGAGVTRSSVDRHLAWKRSASSRERMVRAVRSSVNWL